MTGPANRRAAVDSTPNWQRFQTQLLAPSHVSAASQTSKQNDVHPYQRQYSHVYHQRLAQLGPLCRKAFQDTMPTDERVKQVERLLELEDEVKSFVVGTLVKENSPNNKTPGEPLVEGLDCRASDVLYLEDESGRVALQFSDDREQHIHNFCTGMVMGICGKVTLGGCLEVDAVVPPALDPPQALSSPMDTDNAPYLLLVSGLQCGSSTHSSLTRDMFLTFLEGRLAHPAASKVARVVICGGLVSDKGDATARANGLRDLDSFLFQVTAGAGVPTDILPGENDPTTANWPQRPLHSSLIPQATRFGLTNRSPNPYASRHEGRMMVATDGRNVHDLLNHILLRQGTGEDAKYTRVTELDALRKHLSCGHYCPTGPTTVPTVPHPLKDPMVFQAWPDVYVTGNCSEFGTESVPFPTDFSRACRLICLPKFCETGEAVLLNLHSLKVELLRFEDDL